MRKVPPAMGTMPLGQPPAAGSRRSQRWNGPVVQTDEVEPGRRAQCSPVAHCASVSQGSPEPGQGLEQPAHDRAAIAARATADPECAARLPTRGTLEKSNIGFELCQGAY